jgi:hypothetical protein
MLKIDLDDYAKHEFKVCRLLLTGPFPYRVRVSSSNEGLHYENSSLPTWDYRRFAFDDPMRITLDDQREALRLPFVNLLWDVKNGKTAGTWFEIEDTAAAIAFVDLLYHPLF